MIAAYQGANNCELVQGRAGGLSFRCAMLLCVTQRHPQEVLKCITLCQTLKNLNFSTYLETKPLMMVMSISSPLLISILFSLKKFCTHNSPVNF